MLNTLTAVLNRQIQITLLNNPNKASKTENDLLLMTKSTKKHSLLHYNAVWMKAESTTFTIHDRVSTLVF